MKAKASEDWGFLETVARAAFANPFGKTRDDLDIVIGGRPADAPAEDILEAVLARVEERVLLMQRTGVADLRRYDGKRKEVLQNVFLFHVFHRYAEEFDTLIQAQLKAGDSSVRVAFADKVLKELAGFGFADEDVIRFFGIFFQLRRAYYFIKFGLVGTSSSMKALRSHLWNCVFTHDIRWFEARFWNRMEDFSLLLLGETGTGKGAAAAAIGRSGFIPFDVGRNCFTESFTRNFVAINLSQFSEGVLESELFGHRKGAFTGAVDNHEGLFSRCAPHGVIFLDEIGDIAAPVQIKLLQVLQDRVFFPVGSHEPRRFSGRVIAATNRSLNELCSTGKFRDDLYYRLCSDELILPPLRQRLQEDPSELDALVASILTRLAGDVSPREKLLVKKGIERDLGREYPWPGNVRELEQAVKRLILTGHYQGRKVEEKKPEESAVLAQGMREGTFSAEDLLANYCSMLYDQFGSYEEVARRAQLDRRTVKKYVQR